MRAVLLVGGLGTRLRPLTEICPKPLVPVAGVPFMTRRLLALRAAGVTEAFMAVQYMAEQFHAAYGPGSIPGLTVHLVEEPEPLGTAGAARHALGPQLDGLDEPLLVLNGDLLTDLDLGALLAHHRSSGALATIAVAEVADTRAYGVVAADAEGRVHTFQEKPAPGTELARTVNTGSYVLEPAALRMIAPGRPAMFERDLFPALLAQGLPIAAFRHSAPWIDIGTPQGYLAANAAVLRGELRGETPPGTQLAPGVWAEEDVSISPDALLRGPLALGRGAVVEAGAQLHGPLVLGAHSRVGHDAVLRETIVWERAVIGGGADLSRCVVASDVAVAPRLCAEGALLAS